MKDKKLLIRESVFVTAFILILSLVLFFTISISRKSWRNGLRTMTEKVLNDYVGVEYIITEDIKIQTPFAVSAAVFELQKKEQTSSSPAYAVLIRAYGITGALPLVYIFDGGDAFFAGMGGPENATVTYTDTGLFAYGFTSLIIDFWQERARSLLPVTATESEKDFK